MKTAAIITTLAVLVLATAFIFATYKYIRRLQEDLKNSLEINIRYHKANVETDPRYIVEQLNHGMEYIPDKYWGKYAVVRKTVVDCCIYETIVKVFTDSDSEFNRREAFELCEILNSK